MESAGSAWQTSRVRLENSRRYETIVFVLRIEAPSESTSLPILINSIKEGRRLVEISGVIINAASVGENPNQLQLT